MNVIHISAECYPFVKIGGLADVVGSLPGEIRRLKDVDVIVILPKYKSIPQQYVSKMEHLTNLSIRLGEKNNVYVGIEVLTLENIRYHFIDNQFYFGSREQVYGYGDDSERFAYFQKAAIASFTAIGFIPDIVHVHDWHTAMVPLLLKNTKEFSKVKTVLSIHNLAYQGVFPLSDHLYFNIPYDGRLEFDGNLNFLKSGIVTADYLSTVSKTYAAEIMTPYFGCGMQYLLRQRKDRLVGILNGIDYLEFSPQTDRFIPRHYGIDDHLAGKKENKLALFKKLGASKLDPEKPLISIVSRLVGQKGLDLVKHVFHEMLEQDDFSFVLLGDGEKEYVDYFNELEARYPKKIKVYIGYSNEIAHLVYAGSDMFLMPSRFEPCGLGQIIALKYGTVPIVRETGGLADTVQPYNEYEKTGNGFSFTNYNAHDMMYVIRYALKVFKDDPNSWEMLVKNAMASDYSWKKSAKAYKRLYAKMIKQS